MMKLVHVEEMKKIEQEANDAGYPFSEMMERAGESIATIVHDLFSQEEPSTIIGLIGSGNNGGDTLIALDELQKLGWNCLAYLVRPRAGDDSLLQRVKDTGVRIATLEKDVHFKILDEWIENADVVLDGILGTGFASPLKKEVQAVLNHLSERENSPFIVAVDCPSGLNCETGEIAKETLKADLTLCLGAVKIGMLKLPAFSYLGELAPVDLDFEKYSPTLRAIQTSVIEDELLDEVLPDRPMDANKGTFGTLLTIAGSVNYTGAALLAGKSAYRVGVGLVQMAVPSSLHAVLAGNFPEATWIMLPHEMGVIASEAGDVIWKNLDRATAILVGPGLGRENTTKEFLKHLLEGEKPSSIQAPIGFVTTEKKTRPAKKENLPPLVLDADALNLLSEIAHWQTLIPAGCVLTPHPGEMARLTGMSIDEIQANRQAIATKFAKEWKCIVVLKGAFTVVAEPSGKCSVLPVATPALARAGTGDILAGIIGGLLAQKIPAYQAACAGVYIHAQAGLFAADSIGSSQAVIAGDVLESISEVFE
jgi:NAD(P)H-hydrate epimerase